MKMPTWPEGMMYHGTVIRGGAPGDKAKGYAAAVLFGRAVQEMPDSIPPSWERAHDRAPEIFDFYDWETDELVIVIRALYRDTKHEVESGEPKKRRGR